MLLGLISTFFYLKVFPSLKNPWHIFFSSFITICISELLMWTTQINIKLHCDGQKTWKRNFECEQVSSELNHKNYILRPPLVMCTSYICRDYKHSVESRLHASSKIPGHHLFFLRLASSGRPRLSRFQKKKMLWRRQWHMILLFF